MPPKCETCGQHFWDGNPCKCVKNSMTATCTVSYPTERVEVPELPRIPISCLPVREQYEEYFGSTIVTASGGSIDLDEACEVINIVYSPGGLRSQLARLQAERDEAVGLLEKWLIPLHATRDKPKYREEARAFLARIRGGEQQGGGR